MKKMMRLAVAFLMFGAFGCENGGDQNTAQNPSPVVDGAIETTETLLAEVDLGEISVKFFETDIDGETAFILREESSAYMSETPLDALLAQDLTYLEIFHALAPGKEAPQALVDAHAQEATDMGREDVTVKEVTIDTNATTMKSTSACSSMAFANTGSWEAVGTKRYMSYLSSENWLGVQDWEWMSGRAVTAWCNDSSSSMNTYWAYRRQLPLGDWQTVSNGALGAGQMTRQVITVPSYTSGNCNTSNCTGDCWAAGDLCFPNQYGWGIAGGGVGNAYYHLRTGVCYDIIR